MEFVCKDPSGDDWHYDNEKYYRMRNGVEMSRLSGKYLPDPFRLWKAKSRQAGSENCLPQYKPSEAIFAMFQHWEGVNAN